MPYRLTQNSICYTLAFLNSPYSIDVKTHGLVNRCRKPFVVAAAMQWMFLCLRRRR